MEQTAGKKIPNVFAYHDYREFLRDWFRYLETERSGFSMRRLAREAQVAVGYLPMVLAGNRGLSKAMLDKIAPHLYMNESERLHLESLRELSEAATPEARSTQLKRLQKKRNYRASHPQEFETFHYLTNWYFVAIRELAAVKGFKLDAEWIQSRLRYKVPLAEVGKAVEFLKEHGFIKIVRGKPQFEQKNLECMGGVFRLALGKFHKEMLALTSDSIDTVTSDSRHIVGHTLAIPEEGLDQVRAILNEALEKIEKLGLETKNPEVVYHISLGAVPLTKSGKGK